MMALTEAADECGALLSPKDFTNFRDLIRREAGIWLRDGKQVMLASRLSRRLRALQLNSFSEYYHLLERRCDGGEELRELINCVTTNKTAFFREPHHFDFLRQTLVPELNGTALQGTPRTVRIWSAACSTGEEPYSIAISLLDALGQLRSNWQAQVVASDIDTTVLDTAQSGVYPEASLHSVPSHLRGRYFLRGRSAMSGQVKVKNEVMQQVEFLRINLMERTWPIEGRFHSIFFRNALIYFDRETQELFLRRMCRHLHPGGYLILGHSEHVPWLYDAVVPLSKTVYQRRSCYAHE